MQNETSEIANQALSVNDIHSKTNHTVVSKIVTPISEGHLKRIIREAVEKRQKIAIAGGRHAMGGQQFLDNEILIDTRLLNRVRGFDSIAGIIEVGAGIMWPELITTLSQLQPGVEKPWVIRQKQTGGDRLSLGGAVAANIHGRGLSMKPFVNDIKSLRLLAADGKVINCSRSQNFGLFRLVVGGYGLFGIVLSIKLRLTRQICLQRRVELVESKDLINRFDRALAEGAIYGDFQFSCDPKSADLLNRGVFSCYYPVANPIEPQENPAALSADNWRELLYLAHVDKARAFLLYAEHYKKTDGQFYHCDKMQLTTYIDHYHEEIDRRCAAQCPGGEMITEIYVPRLELETFLANAADYVRDSEADLIYGTVRLIKKDTETFLAWAQEDYACVIFNLHFEQNPESVAIVAGHFRVLIDLGLALGGCFYLTYHRFASSKQLQKCYPQLPYFLAAKKLYDPEELFQSNWYQHYREMFEREIRVAERLSALRPAS